MARYVNDIPGLEVKLGQPVNDGGLVTVLVSVEVTSWFRLLWHMFRTEYNPRWWQWPFALWALARVSWRMRKEEWRASTSSGT